MLMFQYLVQFPTSVPLLPAEWLLKLTCQVKCTFLLLRKHPQC